MSEEALRCAGIQRFVDTYLDGEFGEKERGEFEQHIAQCESCKKRVKVQAEWKVAVKQAAPREQAPAALRNRIQRAIAKEARGEVQARAWRRFAVRVLPVAAAAGLVGTVFVARMQWSPVAADIVAKHQRNLPVEVSGGTDQVRRWYADKLGVPVRPPSLCPTAAPPAPPHPSCALRGGRLADIANQQAAYLVYDVNGNKVSVFVFDPTEVPVDGPHKTVIGNREVYYDDEKGYHVALFRENGVGYAIASDLDRDQMFKLVSSAVTSELASGSLP